MSLKQNDVYEDAITEYLQEKGMTPIEISQFLKIYGYDFTEEDIPAYIKERQKKRTKKIVKQTIKMTKAFMSDFSKDYPLGGSIEPYDIEVEKKLCHE